MFIIKLFTYFFNLFGIMNSKTAKYKIEAYHIPTGSYFMTFYNFNMKIIYAR